MRKKNFIFGTISIVVLLLLLNSLNAQTPHFIGLKDNIACFDKINPIFQFSFFPHLNDSEIKIEGKIIDSSDNLCSLLDIIPFDEYPGFEYKKPIDGNSRKYLAVAAKKLPPGKYKAILEATISTKTTSHQVSLEIFETNLTPESENELTNMLLNKSFYGNKIKFRVIPSTGEKIEPKQFRIYISTNTGGDGVPIEGLSVSDKYALELSSNASFLTVRISWIQPFTGREYDLYPERKFEIKQAAPLITTKSLLYEFTGDREEFNIICSGINIKPPIAGINGELGGLIVECGDAEISDGLENYLISSPPSIEGDTLSGLTINCTFVSKTPNSRKRITGAIKVPVIAYAVNPVNGRNSEKVIKTISLDIDPLKYRIQKKQ